MLSDGVEYLLYEHVVARKRMTLPTSYPLPFGLRGDETRDELSRVMRDLIGVETRIVSTAPGSTLITHEGTLGALENPVWLDFELDARGRLKQITWQGPPTT